MQIFQIVAMFDKVGRQLRQQLRMGRRVERRQMIGWIDDPPAKIVSPDAVRHRLGKVRIIGPTQPRHHLAARVLPGRDLRGALVAEKPKRLGLLASQRAADTCKRRFRLHAHLGPLEPFGGALKSLGLVGRALDLVFQFGGVFLAERFVLRLLGQLLGLLAHLLDLHRQHVSLLGDLRRRSPADRHEEIGEAQEIVLLPNVVGMAMALGTFHPQPEKRMGDLQRAFDARRARPLPEEIERAPFGIRLDVRVLVHVLGDIALYFLHPVGDGPAVHTGREQNAFDELIVGDILLHPGPQPLIRSARAGVFDQPVLGVEVRGAQDVAELGRPQGRVAGPIQQLIDLLRPLVGRLVRKERTHLVRRRQRPGDIEADAAQKRDIVAHLGRVNVEPTQLGEHVPIDEVVFLDRGEVPLRLPGNQNLGHHRIAAITGDDNRIADADRLDLPGRIDLGDRAVARFKRAEGGHILGALVGKRRLHLEAKALARLERPTGRDHAQPRRRRQFRRIERRPRGDPVAEQLIFGAADFEPFAPLMGNLRGRLEEQEAAIGIVEVEPPPAEFAHEPSMIEPRIRPEEGEPKAVLPLDRPMTGPRITPQPAKKRHHMPTEPRLAGFVGVPGAHAEPESDQAEKKEQCTA